MLNYLLLTDGLFPGDWSQFLSGVVATAIGFALTLIGDRLAKHLAQCKRRKVVVSELKTELNKIKNILGTWKETVIEAAQLLPTDAWDLFVSTGELSLLNKRASKKPCAKQEISGSYEQLEEQSLQIKVSQIYSLAKSFNAWLQKQTDYFFEKNSLNNDIKKESVSIKSKILQEIDEILQEKTFA